MIRGEGMRVALVDSEHRIRLRPVKIGRNYGESLEVLEGVAPSDQLVLNPSDSLAEGDVVAVAQPGKGAAPAKSAEATPEKAVR
jgi:hypothetical protein